MMSSLASDTRAPPSDEGRLDRAFRVYRRRIARCRTENQQNRVHIALDNYMTPAEVRHFAAALSGDASDSPSRRWIAALVRSMPVNQPRPVEFERREILKGVTHYSANARDASEKTLIIGFSGIHHRLMAPTPWLLDCLNPALYDVIVLRDFSKRCFAFGIPGLGGELFEVLSGLTTHVDPRAYRNAMSLGTSGGGVPAILAAIRLGLHRGVSICPPDFPWFAAYLKRLGVNDEPYAAVLASRPRPYPHLVLVCGAEKKDDLAAAVGLHARLPSQLMKVRNCAQHGVLKWHIERGTLRAFLAKVLDQSTESRDPLATGLTTSWVVGRSS